MEPQHHLQTITLKCQSCGGNLSITNDIQTFACGYCGTQQLVVRQGGIVSLKLLTESVGEVKATTERIEAGTTRIEAKASRIELELRLKRLNDDVQTLNAKIKKVVETKKKPKAVDYVGTCMGCLGTIAFIPILIMLLAMDVHWFLSILLTVCISIAPMIFVAIMAPLEPNKELMRLEQDRDATEAEIASIRRQLHNRSNG